MGGESVKLVTVSRVWCDSMKGEVLKKEREGER